MADNLIAQNFAACLDNARPISITDSNKRVTILRRGGAAMFRRLFPYARP